MALAFRRGRPRPSRRDGTDVRHRCLIAAEARDRLVWSLHRGALACGMVPTVPAGVLAEAWRGGPQHMLAHLLEGCRVETPDEAQARAVGVMAAQSGLNDTVDLAVTECALRRSDSVITSTHTLIEQAAVGRPLVIQSV